MKNIIEGIGGAFIMVVSLATPFLNNSRRTWGATKSEIERTWPGDESVPHPKGEYMHAITINAPATVVRRWLIQIGQDRGGFYSYEFLENLIGCKIHNADKIIPEFQHLDIDDDIPMHPKMGFPYKVAAIDTYHTLLLTLRADVESGKSFELVELPRKYQNQSWLFSLESPDEHTTRLVSRSRNDWNKSMGNTIFYGIFGPITIEMDRKMLKGIKKRAEAHESRCQTLNASRNFGNISI